MVDVHSLPKATGFTVSTRERSLRASIAEDDWDRPGRPPGFRAPSTLDSDYSAARGYGASGVEDAFSLPSNLSGRGRPGGRNGSYGTSGSFGRSRGLGFDGPEEDKKLHKLEVEIDEIEAVNTNQDEVLERSPSIRDSKMDFDDHHTENKFETTTVSQHTHPTPLIHVQLDIPAASVEIPLLPELETDPLRLPRLSARLSESEDSEPESTSDMLEAVLRKAAPAAEMSARSLSKSARDENEAVPPQKNISMLATPVKPLEDFLASKQSLKDVTPVEVIPPRRRPPPPPTPQPLSTKDFPSLVTPLSPPLTPPGHQLTPSYEMPKTIPWNSDPVLTTLTLTHANITTLPVNLVDMYPRLEALDVSHNPLTVLELKLPDTLKFFKSSNCGLESVKVDPPSALESIDLSYNQIRRLADDIFSGCKGLKVIVLKHNTVLEVLPSSLGVLGRKQNGKLEHLMLEGCDKLLGTYGSLVARLLEPAPLLAFETRRSSMPQTSILQPPPMTPRHISSYDTLKPQRPPLPSFQPLLQHLNDTHTLTHPLPAPPPIDPLLDLSISPTTRSKLLQQSQNSNQLTQLLNEFLKTEETYVSELCVLENVYMSALTGVLAPADKEILWGNVSEIIRFHGVTVLAHMQRYDGDIAALAEGFQQWCMEMERMYTIYYNTFESANAFLKAIESLASKDSHKPSSDYFQNSLLQQTSLGPLNNTSKQSKKFAKKVQAILQEVKTHKSHTQISLQSYLIMPVQRLPRYKLLWDQIAAHTPVTDPGARLGAWGASKALGRLLNRLNEGKKLEELRKRGAEVKAAIVWGGAGGSARGGLLKEGVLRLGKCIELSGGEGSQMVRDESCEQRRVGVVVEQVFGEEMSSSFGSAVDDDDPMELYQLSTLGTRFQFFLFTNVLCWCRELEGGRRWELLKSLNPSNISCDITPISERTRQDLSLASVMPSTSPKQTENKQKRGSSWIRKAPLVSLDPPQGLVSPDSPLEAVIRLTDGISVLYITGGAAELESWKSSLERLRT
ncbi:hypothetical protein HDV05_005081 [Chytridiales sp. JEL 0842]|nr:hypothetical protein HDV05_005081 [Chytridiales sp. JEL 0842]